MTTPQNQPLKIVPVGTTTVPYTFGEMEALVGYLAASSPRFWAMVGQHLDPDAMTSEPVKLAVKAAQQIAHETGQGPSMPLVVAQRVKAWVTDRKVSQADLDAVTALFAAVEAQVGEGRIAVDEVANEIARELRERERGRLVQDIVEAAGKGKSLASFAGQLDRVERIGSPDTVGATTLGGDVWTAIEDLSRGAKLSTGIGALDAAMGGGINPQTLTIVGADQNVGKTAFMVHLACFAWLRGYRVLFVPTEESVNETLVRVVSWVTGLAPEQVEKATPQARQAFTAAATAKGVGAFAIEYLPQGSTVARLRQAIQQAIDDHPQFGGGVDLVVVDYMDKLSGGKAERNRYEEMGAVAEGLRQIAVDHRNWIVTGSQLKDHDGIPTAQDLRDSRRKGDTADAVIIVHRAKHDQPEREYVIAKHRGKGAGEIVGPIPTHFDRGRIAPLASEELLGVAGVPAPDDEDFEW